MSVFAPLSGYYHPINNMIDELVHGLLEILPGDVKPYYASFSAFHTFF